MNGWLRLHIGRKVKEQEQVHAQDEANASSSIRSASSKPPIQYFRIDFVLQLHARYNAHNVGNYIHRITTLFFTAPMTPAHFWYFCSAQRTLIAMNGVKVPTEARDGLTYVGFQ